MHFIEKGKNDLLAECYRNEQKTRCKAVMLVCFVLFLVLCFAVGYSIK